jgi:serine kinase of HPr protein (carbohydrate metabolism regulator)
MMPDPLARPENIHATALLIGDRGILVKGPAGSGKTTLALALIDHFRARNLFSRLVGDDQLFVAQSGGRLICRPPPTIAGLVEVPGIGPQPMAFEPGAVVDLLVRLVPVDQMMRFQDDVREPIAGCPVPRIDLAERNIAAALPVLAARLSAMPFGQCRDFDVRMI